MVLSQVEGLPPISKSIHDLPAEFKAKIFADFSDLRLHIGIGMIKEQFVNRINDNGLFVVEKNHPHLRRRERIHQSTEFLLCDGLKLLTRPFCAQIGDMNRCAAFPWIRLLLSLKWFDGDVCQQLVLASTKLFPINLKNVPPTLPSPACYDPQPHSKPHCGQPTDTLFTEYWLPIARLLSLF